MRTLIVIVVLATIFLSPCTAGENAEPSNSMSINVLNLISFDVAQYPIGIELKYARELSSFGVEVLGALNYATEKDFPSYLYYIEPRIRTALIDPFGTENSGFFLSAGVFFGYSNYSDVHEQMLGVDVNGGYRYRLFPRFFIELAAGLQYPDFALARCFRIHYLIPDINYVSVRTSLGLGYAF